ncbi:MAG: hypothetical protein ACREO4_12930, partial [Lysobacter sp.]
MEAVIARTIRFPKPMKRGAKVRKGPMATVIRFPAELAGDELRSRWAWLLDNYGNWGTEDPDGFYEDREDWDATVRNIGRAYASLRGMEFGDASLRQD